jgi:hypothetical protein
MNKRTGFLSAVVGLVAGLFLLAGGPQRPAVAQEGVVRKWDRSDFVEAGSLICAWKKGKCADAVKFIKDQGFKIVDVWQGEWVVCEWDGKLNGDKLEALKKHASVRHVEPNFPRYITPDAVQGSMYDRRRGSPGK